MGVAALCVGCGDDADEGSATSVAVTDSIALATVPSTATVATDSLTAEPSNTSEVTVTEPGGTGPIDSGVQPQVDIAIADLAVRLSVDPAAIRTVSATFVVWPDKGLGCPQPGMGYLQVQVDGTLIELEVDGERYRYHSGDARPPFLCERTFSADALTPDDSTPDAAT